MECAPIALFVFNRPRHTEDTVTALKNNDLAADSDLIVFSDGPRSDKDIAAVDQVRKYLNSITGFRSVAVIEAPSNKGLAKSIIDGVTHVLSRYPNIIVLEDDMVSSRYFLRYMNDALAKYAEHDKVISIHAYMYPVNANLPDTFFIKGAECWGWATWQRGWNVFNPNGWYLLYRILAAGKITEFDFEGSYPYTRMLFSQCIGRVNSWAIRWYASAFLEDKLTLYPGRSLIANIGLDDSGTHSQSFSKHVFETELSDAPVRLADIQITENKKARRALADHFRKTQIPIFKKVLFTFIRRFGRKNL